MAVFIIVPTAESATLESAIKEQFPEDSLRLPRGEWLVKFGGTTTELSNLLKISGGVSGNALVAGMSGYYGHAPTNIWEWLKSRWA